MYIYIYIYMEESVWVWLTKPLGSGCAQEGLFFQFCFRGLQFWCRMAHSPEKPAWSKFVDHEPRLQQVLTRTSNSESPYTLKLEATSSCQGFSQLHRNSAQPPLVYAAATCSRDNSVGWMLGEICLRRHIGDSNWSINKKITLPRTLRPGGFSGPESLFAIYFPIN